MSDFEHTINIMYHIVSSLVSLLG